MGNTWGSSVVILGPLLFNIYIWDMFFEAPSNIAFAGYVDDNTPYSYSSKMQTALNSLREAFEKLFQWFSANYLVANGDKYHLVTSSKIRFTYSYVRCHRFEWEKVKLLGINLRLILISTYMHCLQRPVTVMF